MLIFFYVEEPSVTGNNIIKINPTKKIEVQKVDSKLQTQKVPVERTNLFATTRGFFRHTECDVDKNGVGVCRLKWGGGENTCQTDLSGFYQCNHLECLEGTCARVPKEGANKCSFENAKC